MTKLEKEAEREFKTLRECDIRRRTANSLTLQFLEQKGLAAAPLGVQAHADGRLHGGLAQDVGQGAAVQVVAQHVPVRLGGRQVLWETRG